MPGRGKGGITGRKNRLAARLLSGLLAGWPLITMAWKWKGRTRWGPSSMKRYPAKRLGYLLCETCYLLPLNRSKIRWKPRVVPLFWKIIQLRISVPAKKLSGDGSWFSRRVCAFNCKQLPPIFELREVLGTIEIFVIEKLGKGENIDIHEWLRLIIILENIGSLKMNIKDWNFCNWEIR